MSLVHGIGIDMRDEALLKASIAMADALKLNVIAEGVETKSQNDFLIKEGCEVFQGFLHGRPMPFDNFVEFLEHPTGLEKQQITKVKKNTRLRENNNITVFPRVGSSEDVVS